MSDAKADGGTENSFNPGVVTSEAEVAEALRMPYARDADKVLEVLEATNAVAIKLESSWWGSETFGPWQEWFLVKPDGVSPSGEALFVSEGISLSDPVGKLKRAESRAEGHNGWSSKAVRRARKKALSNWDDDYMVGPGGGSGFDDRENFTDASAPLSVIETAFRTPEPEDDLVFPAHGEPRTGKMSEGDVRVVGLTRTQYGEKAELAGDTYSALSSEGDNLSDTVWDDAHPAYNGDAWTCDSDGDSLLALIDAVNDAGYDVSVAESFEDRFDL